MHKILIVDDEKPARDFIADLVALYIPNAKVTQTDHPRKALAYFQKEDYDMLFLDIRMPDMNGLELLEHIKSLGKNPYTIIISAYSKFNYAVKGMELGVVKYITKPLYKEKVYDAIRLYLRKIMTNFLDLKVPEGILRVEHSHIIALETIARGRVLAYTTSGIIPDVTGTLSLLYKILPPNFHYIKRNCIVNNNLISSFNPKTREVVVSGMVFAVSRGRWKQLRMEN